MGTRSFLSPSNQIFLGTLYTYNRSHRLPCRVMLIMWSLGSIVSFMLTFHVTKRLGKFIYSSIYSCIHYRSGISRVQILVKTMFGLFGSVSKVKMRIFCLENLALDLSPKGSWLSLLIICIISHNIHNIVCNNSFEYMHNAKRCVYHEN